MNPDANAPALIGLAVAGFVLLACLVWANFHDGSDL